MMPPRKAPAASVLHWVVWVSELAVCNSSLVAMEGKMDERPLVKKGEASINRALSAYSSQVAWPLTVRMKPSATMARMRSLAIMMRLRSKRSSVTPASGPASAAGMGAALEPARIRTSSAAEWNASGTTAALAVAGLGTRFSPAALVQTNDVPKTTSTSRANQLQTLTDRTTTG